MNFREINFSDDLNQWVVEHAIGASVLDQFDVARTKVADVIRKKKIDDETQVSVTLVEGIVLENTPLKGRDYKCVALSLTSTGERIGVFHFTMNKAGDRIVLAKSINRNTVFRTEDGNAISTTQVK